MDIQFINITSYRGISSNAEHYYAKYISNPKDFKNANESIITGTEVYGHDEELKFYPGREDAIALCKKDNQMLGYKSEPTEEKILEMQLHGTIRFPSILEVIKTARAKWPSSILYFCLRGSSKEFKKWLMSAYESKDEKTKAMAEEAFDNLLNYV